MAVSYGDKRDAAGIDVSSTEESEMESETESHRYTSLGASAKDIFIWMTLLLYPRYIKIKQLVESTKGFQQVFIHFFSLIFDRFMTVCLGSIFFCHPVYLYVHVFFEFFRPQNEASKKRKETESRKRQIKKRARLAMTMFQVEITILTILILLLRDKIKINETTGNKKAPIISNP